MDALVFSLCFFLAAALVFAVATRFDRRGGLLLALAAAAYLGLDDFVTGIAPHWLRIPGADWNWVGKVGSLLLAAAVIRGLRLSPAAIGLCLRQRHAGIGAVALVLLVFWGAGLGAYFQPGPADLETLLFQASMPGLAEELAYRGIAPALLLGLLGTREAPARMPWAVIVATSLVFALWHGLGYSDGSFRFDAMAALFPGIGSVAAGWLRFKTGSLLVPVLGHGLANTAFHLVGGGLA